MLHSGQSFLRCVEKEQKLVQSFRLGKRPDSIMSLPGWVGIYLLVLQALLPGVVLCVGGTTHMAVETAYTDVHGTPFQQGGERGRERFRLSIHHDDYPLGVVATNESAQRLMPEPEPFALAMRPFVDVPPSGVALPAALTADAPRTSLRTVILRI
jgi:hypothetical protein